MEKGSHGVSNKIGPLAYDELSKNCDFSKNCEKLEKLQFLLRLIKSSGIGGRRVSSKNCDFCNFSKNCEKLEKSLFLLKLSQVLQEVEGCPAKTVTSAISTIFSKNCKKMGEIEVFAKINYDKTC